MKIFVLDLKGQYKHLIWRTLRDLGVESRIVANSVDLDDLDCDGLVLSGGPFSAYADIKDFSKMGNTEKIIKEFSGPILGICLGHQAIGHVLGGKVSKGKKGEYGYSEIIVDQEDDILRGIKRIKAWVSHFDEVREVPEDFTVLAHSDICNVEAMKSEKRPVYGVQFHPEVSHTERGEEIFKNFIDIVRS